MGIHFGADYYPEHWPQERWETDARLMSEMGLKVVRLAEFSWHKMEPDDGKYDFEWIDAAISVLSKYDIKVVLGTPTAAPPAWLINKYPEILPIDSHGVKHGFGGRHHDCQSNKIYRKYVSDIVTNMAMHFKDNKNVIGWQIDNELGNSHDDLCHCESCRKAFKDWLKAKYKKVDELNKRWGTAFWSEEYNDFDEIFTTRVTVTGVNPSQMLDWRLFHSDLIFDFAALQAEIIRKYCPNQFITHNCMDFADTVDYYKLGEILDFACQDQYPLGYWFKDGKMPVYRMAATVDVVRSFKNKPIWIMEQEAGITGWGMMGRLPKPGELSEFTMQSIAHGADCVVFFRWRSCVFGTEQYWHGILPHSGTPGRTYGELKNLIQKINPIMDDMEGAMPENPVGIVYSYRQNYALREQPHNGKLNYHNQLMKYYKGFYDKNVSVDFVYENGDFGKYKLLVAPLQYTVSSELKEKFDYYVKNGGTLVLTMRAGVKDEYNICNDHEMLPGVFGEIAGITIPEYDSIGVTDTEIPLKDENNNRIGNAVVWADLTEPNTDTQVLARYDGEFYMNTAAITVHTYGKGKCIYVGCEPDDELLEFVTENALNAAGIEKRFFAGKGVEITSRIKGHDEYIFVINTENVEKKYEDIRGKLIFGETKGQLKPFETHVILTEK